MESAHKITDIRPQQKRRDRVAVFLDGEFAFGLHQDVLLEAGIAAGDTLNDEQIERVKQLEERRAAKEKAFRLLAHRARSRREIATRLQQAGFSPKAVEWTLQELERLQLVNDGEFARLYGRTQTAVRPVGAGLLRFELRRRGIGEAEIEAAVAAAFEEKSEAELARALAARAKKKQMRLDEEKAKQRVGQFLLRRGFSGDLIAEILRDWEHLNE